MSVTSSCLSSFQPLANRFADWMLARDCIQLTKWQRSVRWIRQTMGQTVSEPFDYERRCAIARRSAVVSIPLQLSVAYLAIKAWEFVDLSNSNKIFSMLFAVSHEGTPGCMYSTFAPVPFTTLFYVKHQVWEDTPCPSSCWVM